MEVIVRINGLDTPYWEKDVEEIVPLRPHLLMPTKVSGREYIQTLGERISRLERENGAEDLTADLRCKRTKEGKEIFYSRSRLVCAARAAGIDAYDTPFTDVDDLEGLEQDALLAKSLGFSGKAVISPRHVNCVNRIFSPSEGEILHARQVLEAIEEAKRMGKGAVSLNGKMIDAPIAARAKQVLEMARQMNGEVE